MRRLVPAVVHRDPGERERVSTPLELLFDLCFVVAVATAAAELHHALAAGHAASGAAAFALLFVPIWWAWMSYTWHASAFGADDAVHRLLALAQMAGVLAVAATLPAAMAGDVVPFTLAYTAMRLPLVGHWLRAARDDRPYRTFALRYAAGTVVAQLLWLAALPLPAPLRPVAWVIALAVDLATPMAAVRAAPGRVFHAGHIAERYGLFTLIVLGETILAVSVGLRTGLSAEEHVGARGIAIGVCALVVAFGLWWLYFDTLGREGLERNRRAAFLWGYGHYVIFASVAAIGAGVQAQLDPPAHGTAAVVTVAVALPVASALAAIAALQHAANSRRAAARALIGPIVAALGLTALAAAPHGPLAGPLATDAALAVVVLAAVLATRVAGARQGGGAAPDDAGSGKDGGGSREPTGSVQHT